MVKSKGKKKIRMIQVIGKNSEVHFGKDTIIDTPMVNDRSHLISEIGEEGEQGVDEESGENMNRADVAIGHDVPSVEKVRVQGHYLRTDGTELPALRDVGGLVAPQSWKRTHVDVVAGNRNMGGGFTLREMTKSKKVKFQRTHIRKAVNDLGFCLIGYFSGVFPGKKAVAAMAESWKAGAKVHFHRSRWIIFQFPAEANRMKVYHGGPYFAKNNCPLLLKIMPECFTFSTAEISKVPVWVNLPCFPIDLWTEEALSLLCTNIGKPLTTDYLTQSLGKLSYAHVLVEVDVSKDLISEIECENPEGEGFIQAVKYEYVPWFCNHCRVLGHDTSKCYRKKTAEKNRLEEVRHEGKKGTGTHAYVASPSMIKTSAAGHEYTPAAAMIPIGDTTPSQDSAGKDENLPMDGADAAVRKDLVKSDGKFSGSRSCINVLSEDEGGSNRMDLPEVQPRHIVRNSFDVLEDAGKNLNFNTFVVDKTVGDNCKGPARRKSLRLTHAREQDSAPDFTRIRGISKGGSLGAGVKTQVVMAQRGMQGAGDQFHKNDARGSLPRQK